MVKSAWWDMDTRGRQLNAIAKHASKEYWKCIKAGKYELAESYFKRVSICEKLMQPYVMEVTGIRKIVALHDRRSTIPELT